MRTSQFTPWLLASALVLAACDDSSVPTSPPASELRAAPAGPPATIVSHNFPITFPSGIAWDGTYLYVSTLDGFRDTYKIDPTTSTIVGTIPGGFNPRDVTVALGIGLALADVDSFVAIRRITDGVMIDSIPIPWRGAGIARWSDTLYAGNLDHDSVLVIPYSAALPTHNIVRKFVPPVRTEGLVIDSGITPGTVATLWAITPFDSLIYEMDLQGNLLRKCYTPYRPGPYGLGGVALVRDTFFIAHPRNGDPTLGTTIVRVAKSELVCVGPVVPVNDTIDIDPKKFPNKWHPHSSLPVKVAALTTPSRDATTLITSTVRFGRTGTEAVPMAVSYSDADGDGDIDAVFTFRMRDAGILCGDTSGRLTGLTTVGAPFNGTDSVLTVGCHP